MVKMKSLPQTKRLLIAAVLFALIQCLCAAEDPFAITNVDSAFVAGLAKLKQAAGFLDDPTGQSTTDWKPNLQLLVGVKAVDGSKRTIYFVQLTTVRPPPTNAAGQLWQPLLRTNHWSWSATNKTQFITSNYPVRVRVFDDAGRPLKEGQTPMAWGISTNGLFDLCCLSFETYGQQPNSLTRPSDTLSHPREERDEGEDPPGGKKSTTPRPQLDERLMVATGGGFLWMIEMFRDLQTVPTVADVWGKAQCAFRWPSLWTLAKSVVTGFTVLLVPRFEQVTLVNAASDGRAGPLYCLPVDMNSEQRNLTRVQIIVGPAHGAQMLLAGIRTIHARHPTKPKQEFLTQVLATGSVREP